jgi:uncharacterized delta-60 repeat protein
MKNSIFIFLFVICSLLFGICQAQVTQQWVARYNGPGNNDDVANSLAVDGSGNVYVTGRSRAGGVGTEDYATIKYNSSGDTLWVRRYNGPGNDEDWAYSLAVDGSGNVYVTGDSYGSGTGIDYATIKYNSSGVQQWVARYNGPGNGFDGASSLAVDGSGNVYVTGYSVGSGTGFDYATIKYNSSGDSLWVRRYNGPGNADDFAGSLAVDSSGNVYVTGWSLGSGTGNDYATIKYNSSGVQLWVRRYNGPGNDNDFAGSLAVDGSGNVYVTGSSYGIGTQEDYATIKYNSSGDTLWVARYIGSTLADYASSLAVDGSGNVYVTGRSYRSGTGYDYTTIKYNSSGDSLWVARYNGPAFSTDDFASSLAVDALGNVYVTGASWGNQANFDYATIKYNSSGVQQWVQRYNGPGNADDFAGSLAVDSSGNVYVTGYSYGSGTGRDYATIKYSQMVGITPISNEIPETFRLKQNYPNPFNPTTKIRFALPKSSFATLVIYDVLGREAAILVNEQLNAGTYEADWNADKFSSGVYYYKISAGDFTDTKKMVLLK